MKNGTAIQTDLHLVGHSPWEHANDHGQHCPQMLQPYDPRWVFAVRATQELRKAPNPIMVSESRERIIRQAAGMGLSRFDALAIISIVAGEAAAGRDPLGSGVESQLTQVGYDLTQAAPKPSGISPTCAAIVTAIVMGVFAYFTFTL